MMISIRNRGRDILFGMAFGLTTIGGAYAFAPQQSPGAEGTGAVPVRPQEGAMVRPNVGLESSITRRPGGTRPGQGAGRPAAAPVRPQEGEMVRPNLGGGLNTPISPRAYSSRPVRGEIRLGGVRQAFSDATVVVTLRKVAGPTADAVADRVAEVRFFHITKSSPDQGLSLPFTFGDFPPSQDATYTLEAYLDLNRNDRQDVGDYWNQRRVEVLGADTPERAVLEDFAPLVQAP